MLDGWIARWRNSFNSLYVKIRVIRGQLPLFIPIRLLIEKPAVVFIGEARENQP